MRDRVCALLLARFRSCESRRASHLLCAWHVNERGICETVKFCNVTHYESLSLSRSTCADITGACTLFDRSITYPARTSTLTATRVVVSAAMPLIARTLSATCARTFSDSAANRLTNVAAAGACAVAMCERVSRAINAANSRVFKASHNRGADMPTRAAAAFCVAHSPDRSNRTASRSLRRIRGAFVGNSALAAASRALAIPWRGICGASC